MSCRLVIGGMVCISVKRDLTQREKRPTISVKRDLLVSKETY